MPYAYALFLTGLIVLALDKILWGGLICVIAAVWMAGVGVYRILFANRAKNRAQNFEMRV